MHLLDSPACLKDGDLEILCIKYRMNTTMDRDFVEYMVKQIVNKPENVEVTRRVDEMGVLLEVKVDPEDMGLLIGRSGSTAKAIRTLARIIGMRNNARVNLRIVEPEGSTRVTRTNGTPAGARNMDDVMSDLGM